MRILLYKARGKTPFTWLEPIVVEPLELSYLQTALQDHEVTILDPLLHRKKLETVLRKQSFDWVLFNGYVTAEDHILEKAAYVKKHYPETFIMVSGVYAQLNPNVFHKSAVDCVVKAHELSVVRTFFLSLPLGGKPVLGVDYRYKGEWIEGHAALQHRVESILPNRELFHGFKHRLYYMDQHGVALIKGAVGCPYNCTFCYCRHLNQGHYLQREWRSIFAEMTDLDASCYWVVDDTMLISRTHAEAFINASREVGFKGVIIGYLRADFIAAHEDLLPALKEAGLAEVIVGFEAMGEGTLAGYDKGTTPEQNASTVALLRNCGIRLSALFIVGLNDTLGDFKALRKQIRELKLELFTLSIWTPMKGTPGYLEHQSALESLPSTHFDFLHLVLPPTHLSKIRFYWECLKCYGILLKRKRVWQMLWIRMRNLL